MDVVGADLGLRGRRGDRVEGVLGMSRKVLFHGLSQAMVAAIELARLEHSKVAREADRKAIREITNTKATPELAPDNRQARRAAERKAQKLLARSMKQSAHRKAKAARVGKGKK